MSDFSDEVVAYEQRHKEIKEEENGPKLTPGREKLKSWLNRSFRVVMTDTRVLIGTFLCTDVQANVILGMASEYKKTGEEERFLGLVMIPGRHIVSMEADMSTVY